MSAGAIPLWQGFDFAWLRAPHRLNHLASLIDASWDPVQAALAGEYEARFTVGRVPDRGTARTFLTGLHTTALAATSGTATLEAHGEIGRPATVRGDPIAVPLPPGRGGTVLLQGFDLRCTSNTVGLHTRGFGFRLVEVPGEDGTITFVPELFVHPANSPDLVTHGFGAWTYRARVDWTVLAGDAASAAFVADPDRAPRVRHHHRNSRQPHRPGPIVIPPHPLLARSALAISGFSWTQRHAGRFGRAGRFLRRLEIGLADQHRHPDGTLEVAPHLWFSNAGPLRYPLEVDHALWTSLIRWRYDVPPLPFTTVEAQLPTGQGDGGVARTPWRLPVA